MKFVILIRHAKSSWDDMSLTDFERPLTNQGKQDARIMAERLAERLPQIDSFISSPAKRARKTACIFAKQYDVDKERIVLKSELYLPDENVFNSVIEAASNELNYLAVFSHNSGITDFANTLVDNFRVADIPTCGIMAVQADVSDWEHFRSAPKSLLFFDFPRNHR